MSQQFDICHQNAWGQKLHSQRGPSTLRHSCHSFRHSALGAFPWLLACRRWQAAGCRAGRTEHSRGLLLYLVQSAELDS